MFADAVSWVVSPAQMEVLPLMDTCGRSFTVKVVLKTTLQELELVTVTV